jgi:hypothetical protein
MAVRVNVQGVGVVEFDDNFKNLSKAEQQDLVNQVANSRRTPGASAPAEKTEGRTQTDTEYLRSALQGILFGFGDEAEGLAFGLYDAATKGKSFKQAYKDARDNARKEIEQFREDDPLAAYGTEVLASLPTALVGGAGLAKAGISAGKGLGAAIGRGAVEGAAYGLGAGEGDAVDQATSAIIGGATGAALTGAVGGALRSTVAPAPTKAAQELMDRGVKLTPGQQSPTSLIGMVDQGAGKIPSIRAAQMQAVPEFNRAAMNEALKDIGKEVPKGLEGGDVLIFGREAFETAYDAIKKEIEVPDLNKVKFAGQAILQDVQDISPKAAKKLQKEFENLNAYKGMKRASRLDGAAFKQIDSVIGKRAAAYQRQAQMGTSVDAGEIASGLFKLQQELRGALVGKTPAATSRLAKTNQGYGKFKIVQDAAQSAGGEFSPAKLAQASKRADLSPSRRATAEGTARMQPLAQAGKEALTAPPDSGTPFGAAMFMGTGDPNVAARLAGAGLLSPVYRPLSRAALGTARMGRGTIEAGAPAIGGLLGGEFARF